MRRFVLVLMLVLLPSFTFSLPQEVFEGHEWNKPKPEPKPHPEIPGHGGDSLDPKVKCAFTPGCVPKSKEPGSKTWLHPDDGFSKADGTIHLQIPTGHLSKNQQGTGKIHAVDPAGTHGIGWLYLERSVADDRLRRLNRENPSVQVVRIQLRPEYFLGRYVVYNGEPARVYEGNDPGELIQRLNQQLDRGKSSIVMELDGFTEKDTWAFTTELSVQQELVDPMGAWTPLSHSTQELLNRYRQPGMKLERITVAKETEGEHNGWFRVAMEFAFGLSARGLGVQFWFRIREQAQDLVRACLEQLTGNHGRPDLSAAQLVERSKRQLQANHPELSGRQIDTELRDEIRHTRLGELLISRGAAA
jgi:hypothetical protein